MRIPQFSFVFQQVKSPPGRERAMHSIPSSSKTHLWPTTLWKIGDSLFSFIWAHFSTSRHSLQTIASDNKATTRRRIRVIQGLPIYQKFDGHSRSQPPFPNRYYSEANRFGCNQAVELCFYLKNSESRPRCCRQRVQY